MRLSSTSMPGAVSATSSPTAEILPELVRDREVAAVLRCEPRFARRVLERLGVRVIAASERTWFVRRDALLRVLADHQEEAGGPAA